MTKKPPPFTISEDEITERLRIDNEGVIIEVYKICNGLFDEENDRTRIIEEKSRNLFTSAGLLLSILFSVGGLVLDKIKNIPLPVIGCPRPYLAVLYTILGLLLIISGVFSFTSMIVRGSWKTKRDEDIFHEEVINKDIKVYTRFMATHVWKLYKNNFSVNQNKAKLLFCGQAAFLVSLGILAIMILIIGAYIYFL